MFNPNKILNVSKEKMLFQLMHASYILTMLGN